jgi:hypothetical protein
VQRLAVEDHAARARRLQRHHQSRQGALARARFADDAQAAPLAQREAHAVQRLHQRTRAEQPLARQPVLLVQVLGLQ